MITIAIMLVSSPPYLVRPCSADDVDINAFVVELREHIRRLKSVEYDGKVRVLRVESDGAQQRLSYRIEFKSDGARYYSRFQLRGDHAERIDRTVAFDGATFESLDEDLDMLRFTSIPPDELPYLFPQPFIYLYGFVLGKSRRLDIPTLNDPGIWRDFQLRISSAEKLAFGSDRSKSIQLQFGVPNGTGSAIFAENKNWLPVMVQSTADGISSKLTVQEVKHVVGNGQEIFFPIKIVDQAYDGDGVLRYELKAELDPESTKLNQRLDSSNFKIDRSRARWLDDVDGRLAGETKIVEINPKPSSSFRRLLLLSIAALCVGGLLLLAIRRRVAKSGSQE